MKHAHVKQLIYSENFKKTDLLENMARDVVSLGGHIEQVRGEAASRLDRVGGIAAIADRPVGGIYETQLQ